MNMWTGRETAGQYRRRSRLRALARKLRDWLDGFVLEEDVTTARPDQMHGESRASPTVSVPGPNAGSAPSSRHEDAGPPEHWLALVREHAPELLVSMEEGRASRQPEAELAINATEQGISPMPSWPASPTANLRHQSLDLPLSTSAEKLAAPTASSATLAGKRTWVQQPKHGQVTAAPVRDARESSKSSEQKSGEVPQQTRDFQSRSRPVPAPVEAQPSNETRIPKAPAPGWLKRIRNRPRELLNTAGMVHGSTSSPPTSEEARHGFEKVEQVVAARSPSRHSNSGESSAQVTSFHLLRQRVRQLLRTAGVIRRAVPSHPTSAKEGEQLGRRGREFVSQTPRTSTKADGTRFNRQANRESRVAIPQGWEPASETEQRRSNAERSNWNEWWNALPGTQPVGSAQKGPARASGTASGFIYEPPASPSSIDQRLGSSGGSALSEHDLWPDLPEEPPLEVANWRESLRDWEHIAVLDVEQRGGK